jgi:hypothetical protein
LEKKSRKKNPNKKFLNKKSGKKNPNIFLKKIQNKKGFGQKNRNKISTQKLKLKSPHSRLVEVPATGIQPGGQRVQS